MHSIDPALIEALSEAAPYIAAFYDKICVVKIGGSSLFRSRSRIHMARDLATMRSAGALPVVIHGGGKRISAEFRRRHIESRFVGGLRVTGLQAARIVDRVLMRVNRDLVKLIESAGAMALGLPGQQVIRAQTLVSREKALAGVDFDHTGMVTSVNTDPVLHKIHSHIPVLTCVGADDRGEPYNINADSVAANVAIALKAEKLIYLTDVPGVLKDPSISDSLVSRMNTGQLKRMMHSGSVTGGMLAKLRAVARARRGGVHRVHIINGRDSHALIREVYTDRGIGTVIV